MLGMIHIRPNTKWKVKSFCLSWWVECVLRIVFEIVHICMYFSVFVFENAFKKDDVWPRCKRLRWQVTSNREGDLPVKTFDCCLVVMMMFEIMMMFFEMMMAVMISIIILIMMNSIMTMIVLQVTKIQIIRWVICWSNLSAGSEWWLWRWWLMIMMISMIILIALRGYK